MFDVIYNYENNMYAIIYIGSNFINELELHNTETDAISRLGVLECEYAASLAA